LKTYRPATELLAEVERTLARRESSSRKSPLDRVVELLHEGRNYVTTGIYLTAGKNLVLDSSRGPAPESSTMATVSATSGTQISSAISIINRRLGVIVADGGFRMLGPEDRVLIRNVAGRIGLFLSGPGKYWLRKIRDREMAQPQERSSSPKRPVSERNSRLRAAAGEKTR
jgi:hypothetical protein